MVINYGVWKNESKSCTMVLAIGELQIYLFFVKIYNKVCVRIKKHE